MPEVILRRHAIKLGLKKYFTGKPCKQGHLSERYAPWGYCVECFRVMGRKNRIAKKGHDVDLRRRQLPLTLQECHSRLMRRRETRKKQYLRNVEKLKAKSRQWYWAHREDEISRKRVYRQNNPESSAANNHRRRTRRKNAEGSFSLNDLSSILSRQRSLCVYCHRKISFLPRKGELKTHVDHIMPLARGGSNWPSNLQMTCFQCNTRKGAKDPFKWAQQIGRLL